MFQRFTFLIAALAILTLWPGHSSTAFGADLTLRCAHDQPPDGTAEIQWQAFKRMVEDRTNGRIAVTVIGGAQLGDEAQLVENLRIGSVDCAQAAAGNIGGHIPKAALLGIPYLIESNAHRLRLIEAGSPFFNAVADIISETDEFRILGFNTTAPRSVYNSRQPIRTPDDLKGMKIRVMTSDVQVESWKALGAVPTALPFAEVYTALQTGVVDAAENSPMFLWLMKHYEAIEYYSLTNHMMPLAFMMLSDQAYRKVPDDLKNIVLDAGAEAAAVGRDYAAKAEEKFFMQVKDAGIKVNEVDSAPFVARVAHLHDGWFADQNASDLLKIIRDEAKKAR